MIRKSATLTGAEINGHTATGDIQPCFQHLPSKGPGVVSFKKTWGWNPTLLLGLHRLEQSSCHCACHYSCVSNGWLANVSRTLGTSESPPALSDWGVIYLSASTSTPSLLNTPPLHQGATGPDGGHLQPCCFKIHHWEGSWIAREQV